eukprot:TRINITY_DN1980_c1_g2_i3.p2 TRINITY_DN1980_c1_g2~~TRINITY_DN1980_c1_g2_i3.p2  ORF type:complete len:328 (+),score=131.71 TRINITY_DN1980_c1_g2_i3:73-1056(+)
MSTVMFTQYPQMMTMPQMQMQQLGAAPQMPGMLMPQPMLAPAAQQQLAPPGTQLVWAQTPQVVYQPQMMVVPNHMLMGAQAQAVEEADEVPDLMAEGEDEGTSDSGSDKSGSKSSSSLGAARPISAVNEAGSVCLRVSVNTPLVGLAGTLAKRLRVGSVVHLDSMGPAAVAQAMRALVLAASFLREDMIYFTATCEFERSEIGSSNESHPSLRIYLKKDPLQMGTEVDGAVSKVTHAHENSVVGKVAGAIARMVRHPQALKPNFPIHLTCGPKAVGVNSAAKAIALARTMLKGDRLDFLFQPVAPQNYRPNPQETLVFSILPFEVTE